MPRLDLAMFNALVFASCLIAQQQPEPIGRSLHIGVGTVDQDKYGIRVFSLGGAVPDAEVMDRIAAHNSLQHLLLRDKEAKIERVLKELDAAAADLRPGDFFLLTFAGHGSQVPDVNGDESDGKDETWCLHDGQFLDDQIYAALRKFRPNVSICIVSDSCHAGTLARTAMGESLDTNFTLSMKPSKLKEARALFHGMDTAQIEAQFLAPVESSEGLPRCLLPQSAEKAYATCKDYYDSVQKSIIVPDASKGKDDGFGITASVVVMSASTDNEKATDMGTKGLFTWQLTLQWDDGKSTDAYDSFSGLVRERVISLNPAQTPTIRWVGSPTQMHKQSIPFLIPR